MPFRSEKQRRYLWATHPELAQEWADEYPESNKNLPLRVRKPGRRGHQKRSAALALATHFPSLSAARFEQPLPHTKAASIGTVGFSFDPQAFFSNLPGLPTLAELYQQTRKAAPLGVTQKLAGLRTADLRRLRQQSQQRHKSAQRQSQHTQRQSVLTEEPEQPNQPRTPQNMPLEMPMPMIYKLAAALQMNRQQQGPMMGMTPARQSQQMMQQFAPQQGYRPGMNTMAAQKPGLSAGAANAQAPNGPSPSLNPINTYGAISMQGDVNGNAAFGTKNSKTPTKMANLLRNVAATALTRGTSASTLSHSDVGQLLLKMTKTAVSRGGQGCGGEKRAYTSIPVPRGGYILSIMTKMAGASASKTPARRRAEALKKQRAPVSNNSRPPSGIVSGPNRLYSRPISPRGGVKSAELVQSLPRDVVSGTHGVPAFVAALVKHAGPFDQMDQLNPNAGANLNQSDIMRRIQEQGGGVGAQDSNPSFSQMGLQGMQGMQQAPQLASSMASQINPDVMQQLMSRYSGEGATPQQVPLAQGQPQARPLGLAQPGAGAQTSRFSAPAQITNTQPRSRFSAPAVIEDTRPPVNSPPWGPWLQNNPITNTFRTMGRSLGIGRPPAQKPHPLGLQFDPDEGPLALQTPKVSPQVPIPTPQESKAIAFRSPEIDTRGLNGPKPLAPREEAPLAPPKLSPAVRVAPPAPQDSGFTNQLRRPPQYSLDPSKNRAPGASAMPAYMINPATGKPYTTAAGINAAQGAANRLQAQGQKPTQQNVNSGGYGAAALQGKVPQMAAKPAPAKLWWQDSGATPATPATPALKPKPLAQAKPMISPGRAVPGRAYG